MCHLSNAWIILSKSVRGGIRFDCSPGVTYESISFLIRVWPSVSFILADWTSLLLVLWLCTCFAGVQVCNGWVDRTSRFLQFALCLILFILSWHHFCGTLSKIIFCCLLRLLLCFCTIHIIFSTIMPGTEFLTSGHLTVFRRYFHFFPLLSLWWSCVG